GSPSASAAPDFLTTDSSGMTLRGGAYVSRSGPLLLLVPLLPELAAGGGELQQGLELGVGLRRRAGAGVAPDQQRPRLRPLGVEQQRSAAGRRRARPVPRLGADLGQRQMILRAPGVDRDRPLQRRARRGGPSQVGQHAAGGTEGQLPVGLDAEDLLVGAERL